MTHNIEVLRMWIRVVVLITAVCTTSLPILYAFFPWRSRPIGKVFMMMAISFALAMDLSAVFSYWKPTNANVLWIFWADVVVLTGIAMSSVFMMIIMIRIALITKKEASNGNSG